MSTASSSSGYEDEYESLEDLEEGGDDEFLGSLLEAQLTHYEKGKCRQCLKRMQVKSPSESYCSPECKKAWEKLFEIRIAIGQRDLQRRGYD